MRFTKAYIPTTKESPKDAQLPSHIYLSRAGFVMQVASGLYNFLPLGKRVLRKIEAIINEEMAACGALEVDLSFVTPAELWEESGRIEKFGKELLRFRDRKENLFVLGPTHEEMMVSIVRNRVTSYKQLPLNVYQIKTKFRDEARPRFGLMRAREFVMKDGYSFHASTED
ncbi:MAG: aminoacyl--tRNA ligase-related protein, partial [Sulfuricurvum sp.]